VDIYGVEFLAKLWFGSLSRFVVSALESAVLVSVVGVGSNLAVGLRDVLECLVEVLSELESGAGLLIDGLEELSAGEGQRCPVDRLDVGAGSSGVGEASVLHRALDESVADINTGCDEATVDLG